MAEFSKGLIKNLSANLFNCILKEFLVPTTLFQLKKRDKASRLHYIFNIYTVPKFYKNLNEKIQILSVKL